MPEVKREKQRIAIPRYQQIAIDLASQIAKQQYKPGDKIFARSSLASKYHVSPETARRAICLLSDMGIVDATKGSGVLITSVDNAVRYIQQYSGVETMSELRLSILESIEEQTRITARLKAQLTELMDRTERFQNLNPFNPFEITVMEGGFCAGKNLADVNFWQNTTATVIAIRHGEQMLMSPGPDAELCAGDILYFVGDENAPMRVEHFLLAGRTAEEN